MITTSKWTIVLAWLAGTAYGQVPSTNDTTDLSGNTGMGSFAHHSDGGSDNTASGFDALFFNTGSFNTASGYMALLT